MVNLKNYRYLVLLNKHELMAEDKSKKFIEYYNVSLVEADPKKMKFSFQGVNAVKTKHFFVTVTKETFKKPGNSELITAFRVFTDFKKLPIEKKILFLQDAQIKNDFNFWIDELEKKLESYEK